MLAIQRPIVTYGVADCQAAMLVTQRPIVTLGGRLVERQFGNVSHTETYSHIWWQTGKQTDWQC